MNIKKRLAACGALALPLAGLAAFGGAQAASAATPLLTCQAVSAAPGATGGQTFTANSSGSNPGSASVDFDASAAGTMELAAAASEGATTLSLTDPTGSTALAVTGQTLTFPAASPGGAAGTYTVTADSFGALPPHTPDSVTITPPLALNDGVTKSGVTTWKPLAAKVLVDVAATTDTPYRTVNDAVITSGSATVTSASAHFVNSAYTGAPGGGDVGAPVNGEIGASGGTGGTAITSSTGTTLKIVSVNSSTSVTLSSVVSQQTSAGPPPTYGNISGTGTVTIGETLSAPANIYNVLNLSASNCSSSANVPGDFAPLTANLAGVGQTAGPNAALAIEAAPPATNFAITFPTIGSGWGDSGGYPHLTSQPTTELNFPGGKDNAFVLNAPAPGQGACTAIKSNCDSYTKGVATGDWPTTKGNLGLGANGLVFCTLGETQAINNNSGPDIVANGGWISTSNKNPAVVCDGGSGNPTDSTPGTALGVVITLELNPSANAYGTDNTPPIAIWQIIAQNASNLVF